MEKKIRGVEQELAMNTLPSFSPSSLIHLIGLAIEELKKKGLVTNIKVEEELLDFMALNGFRVYNDMSHLELSSPSYNSPLEAVVYDKVAELFAFYAGQGLKTPRTKRGLGRLSLTLRTQASLWTGPRVTPACGIN